MNSVQIEVFTFLVYEIEEFSHFAAVLCRFLHF